MTNKICAPQMFCLCHIITSWSYARGYLAVYFWKEQGIQADLMWELKDLLHWLKIAETIITIFYPNIVTSFATTKKKLFVYFTCYYFAHFCCWLCHGNICDSALVTHCIASCCIVDSALVTHCIASCCIVDDCWLHYIDWHQLLSNWVTGSQLCYQTLLSQTASPKVKVWSLWCHSCR